MGDLKTPWTDVPAPTPDLGGDGILKRGGDPNAEGGDGPNGLNPMWNDAVVPTPGGPETPNSVSGLPGQPARWEPSGDPPPPPSLQDRSPGTIDEQ